MKELATLKQFSGLDQQCQGKLELKQLSKTLSQKSISNTVGGINNNSCNGTAAAANHANNKGLLLSNEDELNPLPHHVFHGLKSRDIIKSRVMHGSSYGLDIDHEDAFYVADLGDVVRQHALFKRLLPRVEPFFAMKCCPDPMVMRVLNRLGTGFDCASKGEIESVLNMGVDPTKIIYANPCKQSSHLRFAASQNVTMMTFDNHDELIKIKKNHPNAQLVLRVLTDDSRSLCKLGLKFGASLQLVPQLLQTAKDLELNVIGISFHVGSGCYDAAAFGDAVVTARKAFDIGKTLGFKFDFLDVGGGFPGNKATGITFPQIAGILGPMIDKLFPPHVRVIAEPGRFFISAAFTLSLYITSRRTVLRDLPSVASADASADIDIRQPESDDNDSMMENADQHPSFMYYVNDGMYGSFNCLTFDHATVHAQVLVRNNKFVYGSSSYGSNKANVSDSGNSSDGEDSVYSSDGASSLDSSSGEDVSMLYKCSIWGPTCDSIDCIGKDVLLPQLNVGDWLVYEDMGAYTMCAASTFNGFRKSAIIYTNTEC